MFELKFYKNLLQNGYYWNRNIKETKNYARKNEIKAIIKGFIKKKKFQEIDDYFKDNELSILSQNWYVFGAEADDEFLSDTDEE